MRLSDIPDEKCDWCGAYFEGKRFDHRFCSRACHNAFYGHKRNQDRSEARRLARSGYVCPECGVTFDAPHLASQIYCSKRCKTREMLRRHKARIGHEEFMRRQRESSRRSKARKKASHVPSHVPLVRRGHMGARDLSRG